MKKRNIIAILLSSSMMMASSSLVFAANYHCQPSTDFASPPPTPTEMKRNKTVLKALCPKGYVPQPISTPAIQQKGKPPHGAAFIPVGYHYVYSYLYQTAKGSQAYFSQHKPYLNTSDGHTLAEIATSTRDARQVVEIGWTVDRSVNHGDDRPHLFIFYWVNGTPTCYNGCGYVQYSRSYYPGMLLAQDGSKHRYQIYYYQGNWWLGYDSEWLGYFPQQLWQNKGAYFAQSELTQWFGEVYSGGGARTQMGNGNFGSVNGSATMSEITLLQSLSSRIKHVRPLMLGFGQTDPQCYNYGAPTANAFRYGGPGC